MKGIGAFAVLVVAATLAGLAGGIYHVVTEIGAERIWQLVTIAVISSLAIAFIRVYLHGLAKIAESKRAGRPEQHVYHTRERETRILDNRPQAPVQLPGLPEPNMAIFPAMIGAAWRQGIEQGGQAEDVIEGETRDVSHSQRVWQ